MVRYRDTVSVAISRKSKILSCGCHNGHGKNWLVTCGNSWHAWLTLRVPYILRLLWVPVEKIINVERANENIVELSLNYSSVLL